MENLCGSCQACCQEALVRVNEEDVQRWRKEQRYEILLCLETMVGNSAYLIHKKENDECIFLTPDGCSIYPTRPQVCKDFPKSKKHAVKFNCQLLED